MGVNASPSIIENEPAIGARHFLPSFLETGDYFSDYITHIRIQAAKTRLLQSNQRINEIAYDAGFNDANYFYKKFKRLKGVSPEISAKHAASVALKEYNSGHATSKEDFPDLDDR